MKKEDFMRLVEETVQEHFPDLQFGFLWHEHYLKVRIYDGYADKAYGHLLTPAHLLYHLFCFEMFVVLVHLSFDYTFHFVNGELVSEFHFNHLLYCMEVEKGERYLEFPWIKKLYNKKS